jgi:biopolymer transport protein ExbD
VSLNEQEQIFLGNQSISEAQLDQPIKTYLQQNPEGSVLLRADKKLAYEKVVQLLGKMRDIGGDRVSLAIDSK